MSLATPDRRSTLTLPNFLIVGAMRAGTTALSSYLRDHPEVFVSKRKEVNFFDAHFDRGLGWYAKFFQDGRGMTAIGEATPSYMYADEAAVRIVEVLPEAKLVAILRNPVDRAYSHYWLNRSRGVEDLGFAAAVAEEPARLAEGDWKTRFSQSYLDRGHYLQQLRRLGDGDRRPSLLVLLFEDLRTDPVGAFGSLCRFLGVDDTITPSSVGVHRAGFRTYRLKRVHRASRHLPPRLRRFVRRLNRKDASYPPLDPSLRRELQSRFEAENAQLADWLGLDLTSWQS